MTDEKHPLRDQTLTPKSDESLAAAKGVRDQLAQQKGRTEKGRPGDPWAFDLDNAGKPILTGTSLPPAEVEIVDKPGGGQEMRIVKKKKGTPQ